jgi:hypothetical protein
MAPPAVAVGGGAGGADRPAPDLQLARRIPASSGGGQGGGKRRPGWRGGGSLTVRRLFMAARREGEREGGTGGRRGERRPRDRRRRDRGRCGRCAAEDALSWGEEVGWAEG